VLGSWEFVFCLRNWTIEFVIFYLHTHTHPFNGPLSRTTRVSRYQKGKTNLDFTKARDSEWQWHQLGHMQVCTLLLSDNHSSTPPLSFLLAGCLFCHPTNSIKALKVSFFYLMLKNWLSLPASFWLAFRNHAWGCCMSTDCVSVCYELRERIAAKQVAMVWACVAKRRKRLGEAMYGVWSRGFQTKR